MYEREWQPPRWGAVDPSQLRYPYPPIFDPPPWPWRWWDRTPVRPQPEPFDPVGPYLDYSRLFQTLDPERALRIKDIIDDGDPPPFWWRIKDMLQADAVIELYRARQDALVKLRAAQMDYMQRVSKIQEELNGLETEIMQRSVRK